MKTTLLQLALGVTGTWAIWKDSKGWKDFRDGSDLQHFVTRPELKAPRYMVAKHHPDAIMPGLWFVTPYTRVGKPPSTDQKDFMPCMNGAHIFDGEGELVWSGACKYDNRNVFNFKPVEINGTNVLTFFLPGQEHGLNVPMNDRLPSGVLMNERFEEISRTSAEGYLLDGHEFNIQSDGRTTLLTTLKAVETEAWSLGQGNRTVLNTGFQEREMATGKTVFDWDPVSYGVMLNESCDATGMQEPAKGENPTWDFFHINSVDKFSNGDYLMSSRHMSTIYRISGKDGHIMWKLGGCWNNSDFLMEDDLPFFWQHHARIRMENQTHTIISVFDNHSEDKDRGEPLGNSPPVGKIIVLDTSSKPMTAKMLRRFDRPDKGQTAALGSVSILGDNVETSNVFIDWAFEGYISEYDADNRLVMEARFVSDRKRSYRAYKFAFKGNPSEPPVMKVLPLGYSQNEAASAFFVSWNGATEVAQWAFYTGEKEDEKSMKHLTTINRRGFETSWVMPGVVKYAYAKALDRNGKELGRSKVTSITPQYNETYTVAYPALQNIAAMDTPLEVPSPETASAKASVGPEKEKVSTTSSSETKTGAADNEAQQQAAELCEMMTNEEKKELIAARNMQDLVVDVFAIIGLFFLGRNLVQKFLMRRRGYKAVPTYAETG